MTITKFEELKNRYRGLRKKELPEQIGALWSDVESREDLTRAEISELFNILFSLDKINN